MSWRLRTSLSWCCNHPLFGNPSIAHVGKNSCVLHSIIREWPTIFLISCHLHPWINIQINQHNQRFYIPRLVHNWKKLTSILKQLQSSTRLWLWGRTFFKLLSSPNKSHRIWSTLTSMRFLRSTSARSSSLASCHSWDPIGALRDWINIQIRDDIWDLHLKELRIS